jgi:hypothetical protein
MLTNLEANLFKNWYIRSVKVVTKIFLFETTRNSPAQLNIPFHFFSKWDFKELYYSFKRYEIHSGK